MHIYLSLSSIFLSNPFFFAVSRCLHAAHIQHIQLFALLVYARCIICAHICALHGERMRENCHLLCLIGWIAVFVRIHNSIWHHSRGRARHFHIAVALPIRAGALCAACEWCISFVCFSVYNFLEFSISCNINICFEQFSIWILNCLCCVYRVPDRTVYGRGTQRPFYLPWNGEKEEERGEVTAVDDKSKTHTAFRALSLSLPSELPQWKGNAHIHIWTRSFASRPDLRAIVCATTVNKFLFNFGLIFLMCNFNLFGSRVSGKFIFSLWFLRFCLCSVREIVDASQRANERVHVWVGWRMARQNYWNSCINDFLIKFFRSILPSSTATMAAYCVSIIVCVYCTHTTHTRHTHTRAIQIRSDLIDVEHTAHSTHMLVHIVQFGKLLRLYRFGWNCFFSLLLTRYK